MLKENTSAASSTEQTKGVETLLGDPKKAIIKLAVPLTLAMLVQVLYNLFDAIWVSGLGVDALAAIGFVYPFFIMALAIASGVSTGGVSGISRRIGAHDKEGADNVAMHAIIIMILATVVLTIPFFIFAENIFILFGAGRIAGISASYARILSAGSIIVFFSFIAADILRGEGNVKRPMCAVVIGAGLNIVLDPIFIYTFGLGVDGAAWATLISMGVTSALLFYWLFLKKNVYLSFTFRDFHFNRIIIKDIFRVGLPASLQQLSLSIMMIMITFIIANFGDSDGVAVYSTGWRIASISTLPLFGVSLAVVPVVGAAFGSRAFDKLDTAYLYAIKIGLVIESVIALVTFMFAPQIVALFTQAESAVRIVPDLELFLRLMCLFYPVLTFGMLSSSMFQATGKGIYAFILTFFRTIILVPVLVVLFIFVFGMNLQNIWLGIIVANVIGSVLAFVWGRTYVNKLKTMVVLDD